MRHKPLAHPEEERRRSQEQDRAAMTEHCRRTMTALMQAHGFCIFTPIDVMLEPERKLVHYRINCTGPLA